MAEAEYAGLGALFGGVSEQLTSEMDRRRQEKREKHGRWLACIMQGNSAQACSEMLGYDPTTEEVTGARRMGAEREAGATREAIGKLPLEEQKIAYGRETQPVPLELRTPTGRQKIGEIPKRKISDMMMGTPRPDWISAIAGERQEKGIAEKRGKFSEKLATEERTEARGLAKEKREEEKQKRLIRFRQQFKTPEKAEGKKQTEREKRIQKYVDDFWKEVRTRTKDDMPATDEERFAIHWEVFNEWNHAIPQPIRQDVAKALGFGGGITGLPDETKTPIPTTGKDLDSQIMQRQEELKKLLEELEKNATLLRR